MKILAKVVLISQTPRDVDGETAMTTTVKLTPVNLQGGDISLSFSRADVKFHPHHELRDRDNRPSKIMIPANSLIVEATVYVKGEKAVTFKAGQPMHPGHPDINPPVSPVQAREGSVYEIDFTEVTGS